MREIKFRAWDKTNEKMREDPPSLDDYGGINDVIESVVTFKDDRHDCGPFILMQYIGRKDKNGVEIYEGDIISYSTSQTQHYQGFVIWYDTGFFCNVFYHKHDKWAYGEGFKHTHAEPQLMNLPSNYIDITIIGNIYENPELLEIAE